MSMGVGVSAHSGKYKRRTSCLQFVCAVGGFVHSMAFFQQFEQLFHWDARVRRAAQREDFPHQDAK